MLHMSETVFEGGADTWVGLFGVVMIYMHAGA